MTQPIADQYPLIVNVRITYKKAPMHILEKFLFKDVDLAYTEFRRSAGMEDCVIIQTCNRIEVYGCSENASATRIIKVWASLVGLQIDQFSKIVEISTGSEAVIHLFRLSSGLDSIVLGEDQILGQVKRSFEYARIKKYSANTLSILFNRAVRAGARVRTMTHLNKGNLSIGSLAVKMAEGYFVDLRDKRILLMGTGEGASLIAKSLERKNLKFMVTSKSSERVKSFSRTIGGLPVSIDVALSKIAVYDLIFVSTRAPNCLITFEKIFEGVCNTDRKMMIFDLSNPKMVDERIGSIDQVKMINMDQIVNIAEENVQSRKREIMSAEGIIKSEMKSCTRVLNSRGANLLIGSIFASANEIRELELSKALALLSDKIGPEELKIIEHLSTSIMESIISPPMNNLREEIEIGIENEDELIRKMSKIFCYKILQLNPAIKSSYRK